MSDNIEDTKKAKIGLAIGMNYRLGPHRSMDISSHVYQDDSIEEINAVADKIAEVAARQQAKAELDEFYEALREETKRHSEAKIAEAKCHMEYKNSQESLKKEWDKKHDTELKKSQDAWANSGRKGEYKPQPQYLASLNNIDASYEKKVSDMTLKYQSDCANHKVNVLTLEERVNNVNRSISRRESIVNGTKKSLKLVNEG